MKSNRCHRCPKHGPLIYLGLASLLITIVAFLVTSETMFVHAAAIAIVVQYTQCLFVMSKLNINWPTSALQIVRVSSAPFTLKVK